MNNPNYYGLLTPVSLGVTRSNGDDFNVQISHVLTEDESGVFEATGIFNLYLDTFGLDKDDFEDLIEGEFELVELPDDQNPNYLGRILFDPEGHWIYDGDILTIAEQEQIGEFILGYEEGEIDYQANY